MYKTVNIKLRYISGSTQLGKGSVWFIAPFTKPLTEDSYSVCVFIRLISINNVDCDITQQTGAIIIK